MVTDWSDGSAMLFIMNAFATLSAEVTSCLGPWSSRPWLFCRTSETCWKWVHSAHFLFRGSTTLCRQIPRCKAVDIFAAKHFTNENRMKSKFSHLPSLSSSRIFLRQCTVEVSTTKFEHIHKHMHREHICTQLCTSMGVFFLVCKVPWIQERLDFRAHGSADRTISPTIEGLWGQLWVTSKLWQVGFWGLAMFFFKEGLLFRQWMVAFWVGSKRAGRKRWPGSRLACLVTCLKNGVYLIET